MKRKILFRIKNHKIKHNVNLNIGKKKKTIPSESDAELKQNSTKSNKV